MQKTVSSDVQKYLIFHAPCDGGACTRRVGNTVLLGELVIPSTPARLLDAWRRELFSDLDLVPGDVEQMSFARTRARWPAYPGCVASLDQWIESQGLPRLLTDNDAALMACLGARYHHDGERYSGVAFCNLFLSDEQGLDVHFPFIDLRIPLRRGTVIVFDPCQPHAVIKRGSGGFNEMDFVNRETFAQVFLTWELPLNQDGVAAALGVTFESDVGRLPTDINDGPGQILLSGSPVQPCPLSGELRSHNSLSF